MWLEIAMMAATAAGDIADFFGTSAQKRYLKMGDQLNQAQIGMNLEAIRLGYEQQSLGAIRKLQSTLSTQAAMLGARGTESSQGSALFMAARSVANEQQDERIGRLNLLSQETQLRAQGLLSGLHTAQSETQLGQALTKRIFDTLPINAMAGNVGGGQTDAYGLGGRTPMYESNMSRTDSYGFKNIGR